MCPQSGQVRLAGSALNSRSSSGSTAGVVNGWSSSRASGGEAPSNSPLNSCLRQTEQIRLIASGCSPSSSWRWVMVNSANDPGLVWSLRKELTP